MAAVLLGACASAPKPFNPQSAAVLAERCDPEYYAQRPRREQLRLDSAYNAEPRMTEIALYTAMPADRARARALELMLACKMPVSGSSEGVLTADYGSHMGMLGTYHIIANVYVVPIDSSTTLIRFAGQETGRNSSGTSTHAISNRNMGQSLFTWSRLRSIAKQLTLDPAAGVDPARSTPLTFVFARPAAVVQSPEPLP